MAGCGWSGNKMRVNWFSDPPLCCSSGSGHSAAWRARTPQSPPADSAAGAGPILEKDVTENYPKGA